MGKRGPKRRAETEFYIWFDEILTRNSLSVEEAAEILGTTRQAIHGWASGRHPLKKLTVAGIVHMLGSEEDDVDELCKRFGVVVP